MPANRRSVYLTDHSLKALRLPEPGPEGEDPGRSLSGRLNAIIARYDSVIRRSTPAFSAAEWLAIMDATNGTIFDCSESGSPEILPVWANVADSPGLAKKWKIDGARLVDSLRKLNAAQGAAVVEVIEAYWSLPPGDLGPDDQLARAGAVVVPRPRRGE